MSALFLQESLELILLQSTNVKRDRISKCNIQSKMHEYIFINTKEGGPMSFVPTIFFTCSILWTK